MDPWDVHDEGIETILDNRTTIALLALTPTKSSWRAVWTWS